MESLISILIKRVLLATPVCVGALLVDFIFTEQNDLLEYRDFMFYGLLIVIGLILFSGFISYGIERVSYKES